MFGENGHGHFLDYGDGQVFDKLVNIELEGRGLAINRRGNSLEALSEDFQEPL